MDTDSASTLIARDAEAAQTYDSQLVKHLDTDAGSYPVRKPEKTQPVSPYIAWIPGVQNMADLSHIFGGRFLISIITAQHMLRGFSEGLSAAAISYLFKDYRVSASRVNLYQTIIRLAYACKISIGMIADLWPFPGYRQLPLMMITSMGGIFAYFWIYKLPKEALSVGGLVFLLFLTRLQASTCEVLTESQVAMRIREDPKHGPDILPFMSGGVTFLNVISAVSYGVITMNGTRDPRLAILVCAILAMPVLIATFFNFHGERVLAPAESISLRNNIFRHKGIIYLSLACNVGAILLAFLQLAITSSVGRLAISIGMIVVLIGGLNYVMSADVARATMTYTLMIASIVDINGATFYFYTDNETQYPEGPHFSPIFFNTVLCAVNGVFLLFGLWVYSNYMQDWTMRRQLQLCNTVSALLYLPDAILFARLNQRVNIPDQFFVLGSQCLKALPETWDYIVVSALIAKSCPPGMEATMFALLAGFASFGAQVNNYLGAFVLEILNVQPGGNDNESAQFKNLWIAALVAALFPLLCLPLIEMYIPNVKQSEDIPAEGEPIATTLRRSQTSRWRRRPASSRVHATGF